MEEIWRDIDGFPDYQISNMGYVKSFKLNKIQGKIVKPANHSGYLAINLAKDNRTYCKQVHRLVLETFKPCDNMQKLTVNHIDHNRSNNYVDNLEWLTSKENSQEMVKYLNLNKPVICLETKQIFNSLCEVEQVLNYDLASVSKCCHKQQNTCHGYHFEFYDSEKDYSQTTIKNDGRIKKIYCYELDKIFNSAKEIGELLHLDRSSITKCCKDKKKSCGGYHFRYATGEEILKEYSK